MVKELIIAILLGSILGFILTGSFLGISKNSKNINKNNLPTPTLSDTQKPTPTVPVISPTPSPSVALNITSPTDNSLYDTAKITVTGNSQPQNTILIKDNKSTYTLVTDNSGSFSIPITLDTGTNLLQITAFDKNDNQTEVDISVTYSTAKI